MTIDARWSARALGGDAHGVRRVLAPGPGHSSKDRSLSILLDDRAPDGFLIHSFAGDDPHECREYVRSKLGLSSYEQTESLLIRTKRHSVDRRLPAQNDDVRRARALATFAEGVLIEGTICEIYLQRRLGRPLPRISDVRFHPQCVRRLNGAIERRPALVALLRDVRSNEPRALHRIFLRADGSDRLRDEMAKSTLSPARGAVVKLTPDHEVTLGLGIIEGLEKGAALLSIGWSPIWCTVGQATMRTFPVLNGIETLTIFADHDLERRHGKRLIRPGQDSARECALRWSDAGIETIIHTPVKADADWGDALQTAAP
jgi:putative DNA primase/helicase